LLEIVQEIGAVAAFATIPGLAVLSALHASHAREVKRLREWAGRAPERSAQGVTAHRRIGTRHFAIVLACLLVLGAAAYGVTRPTGDHVLPNKPKRPALEPGNVTVAVLNGTTVPGLAAALSGQIGAAGFKQGTINDYPDKQLAESVVQYAPGHQAEAKAVSRRVGISQREPVTANSRALAGDATVIVIAGGDKAP
jgi:LytR cell envelope-related transcriptional attenuator